MARRIRKQAPEREEPLPLQLIQTAQIASIRLEQVSARCKVESADALPTRHLHIQFATASTDMESAEFRVRAEIDAAAGGAEGASHDAAPVQIRAVYILRYRVPGEVTPSKRDLSLFAETNAVLNIWPYWRQLVHDMSVRMELPPILLPLFRVGVAAPK
jgi:preprotein translocase subunit SecB